MFSRIKHIQNITFTARPLPGHAGSATIVVSVNEKLIY
jgi:hypothetical protein